MFKKFNMQMYVCEMYTVRLYLQIFSTQKQLDISVITEYTGLI